MIYMQTDGKLWTHFGNFIVLVGLMILFLSIFLLVSVEINLWGLLICLIIFFALVWLIIKSLIGCITGLKTTWYVTKEK